MLTVLDISTSVTVDHLILETSSQLGFCAAQTSWFMSYYFLVSLLAFILYQIIIYTTSPDFLLFKSLYLRSPSHLIDLCPNVSQTTEMPYI